MTEAREPVPPSDVPAGKGEGTWLLQGGRIDEPTGHEAAHPWYTVLWLTGVDYFSTLGYQPGIALLAAGAISPLATGLLIIVTLLGALPVYAQVASRSYAGQGSIAMLESLLPGWGGRIFVLVLLGFAATDFVITMTLSAADAAQHAIENPYLRPYLGDARLAVTLLLLALLAAVFVKGFVEAIGLAMAVAVPYLLLNVVVLARGVIEVLHHPEALPNWRAGLAAHGDWTALLLASAIIFPRLALGLSGFETGVTVMPLISGGASDPDPRAMPAAERTRMPLGRIRATRKLLAAAAVIMSVMLLGSSLITTLLVPVEAYRIGGAASGRAIAYLAHHLLGNVFGTIYDLSTITILWFAGASAMAGLLNLVPRYLPRFGMAPRWTAYRRPLVLVLFAINVVVTLVFHAEVEAQAGAYATGVLVLILSASIAVALALGHEVKSGAGSLGKRAASLYFWAISAVFTYTLLDNVHERPDGVIIASIFILLILLMGAVSRYVRATELRVARLTFEDAESEELWNQIVGKKVHLVPARTSSATALARKAADIHKYYSVNGPLAFMHVNLLDNRSEFLAPLCVKMSRDGPNYVIEVSRAIAIANTIAYISERIDPIAIFLQLTRLNLMAQSFRYLLWGEGETGLLVYTILLRYWKWTPEEDVRPLIFLMSE